MSKQELDNLVRVRQLNAEPPTQEEFTGMVTSAKTKLVDAQNEDLAGDSQFDLAYGAAHRLALAALRHAGYRSENRITVFQTLAHTVGTVPADIQVFLRAHNERNLMEYQGRMDIDEQLLVDLIRCTKTLQGKVEKLAPLSEDEAE
jgi:hypothetical protein